MKYLIYIAAFVTIMSCKTKNDVVVFSANDSLFIESAKDNATLNNSGYIKCRNYRDAWLQHADPETGLIPRNLHRDSTLWNGHDAGADNYPFMVLTSALTDSNMLKTKMISILETERKIACRVNKIPEPYDFRLNRFQKEKVDTSLVIFGGSEYVKDGLLPLTEWMGESPWSERMLEVIDGVYKLGDRATNITGEFYGNSQNEEVNGELLQILSRLYWMTGKTEYLDWALNIADFYLLGEHHPTKDLEHLRLRDHGCEIIAGLSEVYITVNSARPEKKTEYQEPLRQMLNRILEVGRNGDGMFYNVINPKTGEILNEAIADTWGYTLNAYLSVYYVDSIPEYKNAVLTVFDNLNKYKNYDWEHGSSDGYADAIESALNLYNRIPDPKITKWIDSEMQVMWNMQQPSGIIEGWHGDGNFARTTIMYCLWKSLGAQIYPWDESIKIGASYNDGKYYFVLSADKAWQGKLVFDKPRHKENLRLPFDYPRINQFPEWFTVNAGDTFELIQVKGKESLKQTKTGEELLNGIPISVTEGEEVILLLN